MKFFVIPYIALGLMSSMAIGIEYYCAGQEMFPEYFGSPFIFREKSLGSSMTYYYSISGLLANLLIWSAFLYLMKQGISRFARDQQYSSLLMRIKKVTVIMLMVFSTLNILFDYMSLGVGFNENSNYWYWDVNKEAKQWGVDCEGKIVFFWKSF